MSEEKKDLLPCPFCGSSAMLEELGDHHGAYHNLGCSKRECPAHHAIYTESEAPVEDSVNWWNTRAALQESEAGAVAWLHEMVEPDGNKTGMFSFKPDNPWSHWMESHKEKCQYTKTPLFLAPQYAQAIEAAAIMKCVEVCNEFSCGVSGADISELLRDLITQDGGTQLEEFGMRDAWKARSERRVDDIREIVARHEKQVADLTQQLAAANGRVEQFAWATFDGEGSYDLRLYQDNENYRDEYIRINGEKYASWVIPLYVVTSEADKEKS